MLYHAIAEFVLHNYLRELGTTRFLAKAIQKKSITSPSTIRAGLHPTLFLSDIT